MRRPHGRGACHGEGPCGRASVSVLGVLPAPPAVGAVMCALVVLAALLVPGAAVASRSEQMTQAQAIRIANRDPKAVEERGKNPGLAPVASMVDGNWEVGYFAAGNEVALVIVDPGSGQVRESWTGYQVAWKMARGYSGAFGHKLDAPYVFLPLCALFVLGIRIRPGPAGRRLAAILAFGWAAHPYTAFTLESNSNDTLVAMLVVATLLVLARPLARGALAALATFTKFAPALLAPMLLTYESRRRSVLAFAAGFALFSAAVMLWPAINPGLHTFYDRTIAYQAGRDSPFSIWGQVPSLEPLRIALLAATAALSLFLAFRPRRKSLVQVAALGAALLIALQLTMHHWFYLYIVWFYPLLLIAMASLESRSDTPATSLQEEPAPSPG